MHESYLTILREGLDEFTVSRSRFIGQAKPVSTDEAALAFIGQIRKSYGDASHHVWAYILGPSIERYSDDGEPQGTAGVPVLEVVRKEKLRDVAVVVTRYFGGVKLGAGGLVRAYSHGAKIALEAGKIIERRLFHSFDVQTDYAFADKCRREISRKGYRIKNTVYLDQVTFTVLVPPEEQGELRKLAADLTAGCAVLRPGPNEYLDFWPDGTPAGSCPG